MKRRAWLPVLALLAAPAAAAGQGLAGRVIGGGDGVVRMSFAAREGVEICADGIRLFGNRMHWRGGRGYDATCVAGPVEIEVRVRDGRVTAVETLDGREERSASARDLGTVDARDAVAFLMDAARSGGSRGRGEEDAILPIVLADVEDAWRGILDIARDATVASDARKSALFWLGQEAAEAATQGLAEVASDEDEEQEVRDAAVFALSQRPPEEGVPVLMDVARTAREPKTRRSAFFWLAQSDDPRVIAFFQEVLLGRRGG